MAYCWYLAMVRKSRPKRQRHAYGYALANREAARARAEKLVPVLTELADLSARAASGEISLIAIAIPHSHGSD